MHLQHPRGVRLRCSAGAGAAITTSSTTVIGSPVATRVSVVCTPGGPVVRTPGAAGDTQPTSGTDPVRAERSEPRSGGLDCRRPGELCGCNAGVEACLRPPGSVLPRRGEGEPIGATITDVTDPARAAIELVASHPAVRHVELAGSRSRGTHEELSDWDFAVTTADFAAVARDMPALVAPLHPLGQQWEPLGHFPVYQVLLPGPTKFEYLFLDHSQEAMPAPAPGPGTLEAINTHFWDWVWWIATKASIGRTDLVAEHLSQLLDHLLRPIGVTEPPADIEASIDAFVGRRDELERDCGVTVSRALEDEVRAGIRRLGLAS
jgi:hypothetical protein